MTRHTAAVEFTSQHFQICKLFKKKLNHKQFLEFTLPLAESIASELRIPR